jgi:pyrimidine-specific ribonucleoside hydrolase
MRRIVLDCDPGHDDAIALLLALARDEWRVDAVTVVAGNQTLDKTVRNALTVLTVAGRTDVPVFAGMHRPLVRDLVTAGHVHGASGLDGPVLPDPAVEAQPEHAVDWLIRHLRGVTDPVDLIATGPLTNVGLVLRREPGVRGSIRRIVLMGGSLTEGNITPAAEFNIYVDPEAAAIVFGSGVPVTMVGLNVTHQAMLGGADVDRIRDAGGDVAEMVCGLLDHLAPVHERMYGDPRVPIHDACAVAAALQPQLLQTRHLRVDVETSGVHTVGQTVCDVHAVTGRPPNADVATVIDRDGFIALLDESLRRYAP